MRYGIGQDGQRGGQHHQVRTETQQESKQNSQGQQRKYQRIGNWSDERDGMKTAGHDRDGSELRRDRHPERFSKRTGHKSEQPNNRPAHCHDRERADRGELKPDIPRERGVQRDHQRGGKSE